MPQFLISEGVHFVSYVTGPRALLLGIRFSRAPAEPVFSVLRSASPTSAAPPKEEVLRAVVAGVSRSAFGQCVEEVVVADQDSAPASLYEHAAFLLAEALVRGESFQHANIKNA